MFQFLPVIYKSRNGKEIVNDFYCDKDKNNSLVVLFPGVNYSFEKPLLYYARKAASMEKMDVLCVRYGYKLSKDDIGKDIIKIIADEILPVIRNCSHKRYNKLYFISKSIGGEIAGNIAKNIGYENVQSLYLTPTPHTVEHMIEVETYTIIGTRDPIFGEKNIRSLQHHKNIKLKLINNAQHSLEVDDNIQESIKILGEVTTIYKKFLNEDKQNS
ncbi:hypothetical protein CPAST_c21830 [Clostridium pasteurianum DSM 525 = ATCC 6013]|uniref:Alpha/beta hydrolase n=2 Tax=Clostridium pasteurianum TaxID=1501 RepID=A0A0H3J8J0_CLOPA|nr:hypothetical protein [Clostridium pasteurianum]AJA48253.1 hypothetical protein CPAST_c21830 [Clostridium pasteurianum DSM 525 = ATCC 6013]AJA52241.1 hypothetical protein CLPA_c21830 [Clostridium pasteurianum DSM 525 = ATCC 6013]AOZ75508.1 hypothetical protein AQ983_10595 [Clostridium pasteurianum DSM 525 = ATCC 6013]AOZ79303.1 hypothetical protein AQ984_10585 [Clostridium pasteurianum]ELP60597.1 hypothetical protein F502_03892 [Clostridium pasteurianum DSM 525 = ATCC 6013]